MWLKIKLYTLSLAFLFLLIGVNQVPICFSKDCHFIGFKDLLITYPPILLFCFGGIAISIVFYYNFRYSIVKGAPLPAEKIVEIESLNYENLTFLATYIIPLVCFDLDFHLTENRNFLMLVLVLLLIGWIYIKTNIFYTNPTLAVLNFKIYKVSTTQRDKIVVISRDNLEKDDFILPNKMDNKIFFVSKYYIKNATRKN